MTRHTLWVGALLVGIVVTAALTNAQEAQSWLHIQIEGGGDNDGNVAVNLPLQAVGAVIAMAPDDILSSDGRLVVAEQHGLSVSDVRLAWQGIKNAGDAEFVTCGSRGPVTRLKFESRTWRTITKRSAWISLWLLWMRCCQVKAKHLISRRRLTY